MRKPYVEQNGHLNASREDLEPGVKLFYRDRITLTARANKLSSKTPFSQKHKGAEDNEQLQVKQGEVHDSISHGKQRLFRTFYNVPAYIDILWDT